MTLEPNTKTSVPMINLIANIALTASLASYPPSLDNDFETALGTAALTRESARFDPGILGFFKESEFSTPLYRSGHENPWRIPFLVDSWKRQLRASVGDPAETVSTAGRMIGLGTRRSLLGNPIQSAIDAGVKNGALRSTLENYKKRGLLTGAIPDLGSVPSQAQEAAAVVLQVALQSIPYRRAAFQSAPDYAKYFDRAVKDQIESADPEQNKSDLEFFRSVDLRYLFAAGSDLAGGAKHAQVVCSSIDVQAKYRVEVGTYWGKVVLSGGTNDTYNDPGGYLMILDTGGSDTYINSPTNRTPTNWCSVVVDSGGNDAYLSDPTLAKTPVAEFAKRRTTGGYGPGGALCGVSVLLDSAGNDQYRSHRPGLGAAFMGVSYLEDSTGDDSYDGYSDTQGSGRFGIGILDDWRGKDTYSCFTNGQGFAGVSGLGLILDRLGDDEYAANTTLIDFPSPQSAQQNVSMAQGAATGRRADYVDGHSLSGGVGILIDEDGSDKYQCGVFGQGVGYWEGVGLLCDEGGDDTYNGVWYVMGASAHFGIGYLEDSGGNDTMNATTNMALGAGHDFGVGMVLNVGGQDKYNAPNLSLGAGNANGIGAFFDSSGDDSYVTTGITLGKAAESQKGSLRERAICLGVFFDAGGNDAYPSSIPWAGNNKRVPNWTDRRTDARESQVGVFWDR